MKTNFQEQFEDSEANFSEMYENEANHNNHNNQQSEEGYPIQLASIDSETKVITLDDAALDIIAECDLPVGFVSMVGRYRVGKSCLLNRMLGLETTAGFKVSSSVRECTKGIWMWSKPFYSAEKQCYLFFMDTEGTEALEKETEIDIKLFTLSCLISSYLVFNSVGNIDERSIEQLNLVTALSKNIIAESSNNEADNEKTSHQKESNLSLHMPKFMWLLRDFTLELRDEYNRQLTPTEYLENCLSSEHSSTSGKSLTSYNHNHNTSQTVNKIKNEIVKLFKNRECFTLVRPAREEHEIQRLNELPDHALRREFLEGVHILKQIIFQNAEPKHFEGEVLYGGSVVSMIETFVESMNNGAIPNIRSAWEQVGEEEGAFAYNRALDRYNVIYGKYFDEDEPFTEDKLHEIISELRDESLNEFNKNITQPNEEYHLKLKEYLKGKEKNIIEVNKQLLEFKNIEVLKDLSMPLMKKIENGSYKGRTKELSADVDLLVKEYNKDAVGETKGNIISEFLTTLNPIIISMATENVKENDDDKENKISKEALEEFDKRTKLMEQQLQALKGQVDSKEAVLKKREKELKEANAMLKKKEFENKGCCEVM